MNAERKTLLRKLEAHGILSIIMMVVIFAFSSMNGDTSTSQSNGIAFWLAGQFIDGFEAMSPSEQLQAIHTMTYPIRKTAHVTEYAVLSGLLVATFWQYLQLKHIDTKQGNPSGHGLTKAWTAGICCAVLYACTDEFHQTFTPGRTGQPIDVCIDSIGIIVGAVVVAAFIRHRKRARR